MRFFYPDSIDLVDPEYDFHAEQHPPHRVRQRMDAYAHELLDRAPYDGLLVSKSIVSASRGRGRYSEPQRRRFLRTGAHRFFRTSAEAASEKPLLMMGDCGAYAYVDEAQPPHTVDEVLDFYEQGRFDWVLSVDHVIPSFATEKTSQEKLRAWRERQELTLDLGERFLKEHQSRGHSSLPMGVAQGWSVASYVRAARALERMGYGYIALGGLAPLSTKNVMAVVEAVGQATQSETRLHLLGVARPDRFGFFHKCGVASFDSTMPLRQAFMDDRHNYHAPSDDAYLAIRVPQVVGNRQLQRKIRRGHASADRALRLEKEALGTLESFDVGDATTDDVIEAVGTYEAFFNGRDQSEGYRRLLEDRPWKQCSCAVCQRAGIHVAILRGRERNKRRGFHNMHVLFQKLQHAVA